MLHQSMSGAAAQTKINEATQRFAREISEERITLADAHAILANPDKYHVDLFGIAGLAKAIACFQCSAD